MPAPHPDATSTTPDHGPRRVSVVIPAAGDRQTLHDVVAVSAADPATLEVIVVDDTALGDLPHVQGSRTVRGPSLGPAAARQAGAEAALGDILLLLDDDVVPAGDLVSAHLDHHDAAGHGVVVVGATPFVVAPGSTQDDIAGRIHAREYAQRERVYLEASEDPLPHLWGGNVSLRRSDALAVGIYSDRFTDRYHEDRDFGLRLSRAGLRGIFDPALIAHHHYRRSFEQWLADARARGAAEVALHRVHGEAIGPAAADLYAEDLRAPARLLVELAERRRAGRPVRRLLRLLVREGGRLHARPVQLAAARVLRRVELRRGARSAGRLS